MHIELAQARLVGGQIDLAIDGLATLLKRNDLADGDRLAILRMLVQAHFGLGDIGAVERLETEAVELAARVDPVAACDILLDSSFVGWLIEGPLSARRKVSRVLDMIASCEISDDRLLATARAADANLSFIEGFPTGNEMLSEVAIAKSARSVLPGTWDAAFGYVNLSKLAEQFDEDAEDYQAMAAAAENEGAVLAFQTYSINYADTLWRIGRIRQAYDLVSRAAELADLVPMLMPFAWVGMAHLSQELGMDEQSSGWAHRLDELLQFIGESAYLRLWLIMFEARDHLRTGHVDEASASALRLAELAEESSIREPCVVPWHATAIEALVAASRLESASKVIEALEEVNSRLPCHTPKAAAAVGRAMIAWRSGDVEAADQLFEEALLHNAAVPMPLAYAETLVAKGRFLRHTGRLQEARKVLRSALGVVESVGAARLQRIALQELAVAGGRRSKGPNIGSLTAQEVRVSELAAEGITNKQIAQQLYISAKTVDHHLSRIYSKLGINSRRELMKVWRDHKLI
jgi:DNA-binding CsgD family transcriptional regulator